MADAVTSEPRSRKRAIAILVLVVLAAMLSIAAVRLRKSPEERAMESLAGFVIARGQQTKMLPERLAYFGFSAVLIVSALVRALSAAVAAAFFLRRFVMSSVQKSTVGMLLFNTLVFCCAAQGQEVREQSKRQAPTHADVRYGPHERNVLDLYLAESRQQAPPVLYIHGGGFRGGDKRSINPTQLQSFLKEGFSVAALHYRLTDTAPAPAAYLDCGRALQFLRHHATKWNLDPTRVASTGGSAGAGISMWLAFHDDLADPQSHDPVARESTRLTCIAVSNGQSSYDPRFAERIGIARPNFERHPFFLPFYGITQEEIHSPKAHQRYEEMAPITYLSEKDPPALLDYSYSNIPVDSNSNLGLVVHHPLFGIALQEQMERLGIECVVQYVDRTGAKVRHNEDALPITAAQFIKKHFEQAESKDGR